MSQQLQRPGSVLTKIADAADMPVEQRAGLCRMRSAVAHPDPKALLLPVDQGVHRLYDDPHDDRATHITPRP
jgi:hypothetical protein